MFNIIEGATLIPQVCKNDDVYRNDNYLGSTETLVWNSVLPLYLNKTINQSIFIFMKTWCELAYT